MNIPGIIFQDTTDNRKPKRRIEEQYGQAALTPQLKYSLENELRTLEMLDQNERKTDPDREEAKELIKKYLDYIRMICP